MSTSVNYDDVLCPELYFRLKKVFGKVYVNSRGTSMVMKPSFNGEKPVCLLHGEYYRVCCPWCSDTRHRLYINHRWFENRHMANCFNETACTRGEIGRMRLDQLHLWLFNTSSPVSLPVHNRVMTHEQITALTEIRPPERCVALSALSEGHQALNYITQRGYNPKILEKYLGVGWITEEAIPNNRERIYIPVFQNGKLMGYQGRIITDDPLKKKQKYINPPGMKKSMLLYNLDNAKSQNVVVICEGPIDVWSVGPSGVDIFGSDCSQGQLDLIGEFFNGKVIAIALDGDASYKADALVDKVQHSAPRSVVIKIPMASKEDPDSLRDELWRRLQSIATNMGVTLPDTLKEWPSE